MEHRANVGFCVLKLDPNDNFSNDDPARAGAITGLGEAHPECFAGSNWSHAIPIVYDRSVPPIVPEGTLWLRIADPESGPILVGIAAPGLAELGIKVGDQASLHWPIAVAGEWGWQTATLEIAGRGRVRFVLNSLPEHQWSFGPAVCQRGGACPGTEHVLQTGDGLAAAVGDSRKDGQRVFSVAEGITRSADFRPSEEGYTGPSGCQGERRASLAVLVESAGALGE